MRTRAPESMNVSRSLSLRFVCGTSCRALRLEQDLFDSWILTRVNGRLNSRLGRALIRPRRAIDAESPGLPNYAYLDL
jgi:hypothetical protein